MTNAINPDGESDASLTEAQAERLARFVSGSMTQEERAQFERELLASESLSEALYADENLRAAIAGIGDDLARARARRSAGEARRTPATWLRFALPIAAGVALAVFAPRLLDRFGGDDAPPSSTKAGRTLRSGKVLEPSPEIQVPELPAPRPPAVASPPAKPLFPLGTFTENPERLEWTSDPAARAYRIEMKIESGDVVFTRETPDTTIAYPARELASHRGAVIEWRVIPIVPNGAGSPSESLRFRVEP